MPESLKQRDVELWLDRITGTFHINDLRKDLGVAPTSSNPRVILHRLVESGKIKPSGNKDGYYRKVIPAEPMKWWDGEEEPPLEIIWPYGVDDNSSFGFDETIQVYRGETIVIAGQSNQGKTCFVLNFLVNNMDKHPCILIGNEYTPHKMRARMKRFDWVELFKDGIPKFDLLPVSQNWQDYIKPGYFNLIDWVNIRDNFYEVGGIIEDIQNQVKGGIAVIVLQKEPGKKLGLGGGFSSHLPSVYLTIDRNKLTVIKVKSPVRLPMDGKTYGFEIIDGGSKFCSIREVKTCPSCKGSGFSFGHDCDKCYGKGFIDK